MNTTGNVEHRDPSRYLITARETAEIVHEALTADKADSAVRWLTEAVARLIESHGKDLPDGMFEEPATTGDRKWDTVLATAFLYGANLCGTEERPGCSRRGWTRSGSSAATGTRPRSTEPLFVAKPQHCSSIGTSSRGPGTG